MHWSAVAMLAGVLFIQQLAVLPSLAWTLLGLPMLALARYWPRFILPLIFLVIGAGWSVYRADLLLSDSLSPDLEGIDLIVEGWIAELPATTERGQRFVFQIDQARRDGQPVSVPRRVLLSHYGVQRIPVVGQAWRLTVRLKRPHGFHNPGGFDYEAHLFQQRLRATGYVRENPAPVRLSERDGTAAKIPWIRINRYRQILTERIRAMLPDHRFTAMLTAFANGDDDAISDDQWDILQRTGTSHLVAISGMNIGWLAGLAYLLSLRLWSLLGRAPLLIPAPRVAAGCALLTAAGYAAMAGFAIPTQRALIMLVTGLLATLSGRRLAPMTLLALALIAVLAFDPLSVLAPGFWLSFLAVAIIFFVVDRHSRQDWRQRLVAWGWLQWAVFLGLMPILLLLFQQVSLSGPLANLVAIPVIEIIVIPATLAGVMALSILPGSVATWSFELAHQTLSWLWPWLEMLAGWPAAVWNQHSPPFWSVAVALVGIAWLLMPRGWPARWVGLVWMLPLVLVRPPTPSPGIAWLTLLDVGQGLSVVIQTATHVLVYDTGARFSARFDAGRAVILPYLRQSGLSQVDTLVLSHGDNDHVGGSTSLRAGIQVKRILSSVPERLTGAEECVRGQQWTWDDVHFEILHPDSATILRGNDRSCVLRVSTRFGQALLPGDISARAERSLLGRSALELAADVLVIPHHGSRSSSTAPFLDHVHPRLVLLPVGYRNRYRHPNAGIVARYRDRGLEPIDSPSAGAVLVRFEREGLLVVRDREVRRRYWQYPERLSGSPRV